MDKSKRSKLSINLNSLLTTCDKTLQIFVHHNGGLMIEEVEDFNPAKFYEFHLQLKIVLESFRCNDQVIDCESELDSVVKTKKEDIELALEDIFSTQDPKEKAHDENHDNFSQSTPNVSLLDVAKEIPFEQDELDFKRSTETNEEETVGDKLIDNNKKITSSSCNEESERETSKTISCTSANNEVNSVTDSVLLDNMINLLSEGITTNSNENITVKPCCVTLTRCDEQLQPEVDDESESDSDLTPSQSVSDLSEISNLSSADTTDLSSDNESNLSNTENEFLRSLLDSDYRPSSSSEINSDSDSDIESSDGSIETELPNYNELYSLKDCSVRLVRCDEMIPFKSFDDSETSDDDTEDEKLIKKRKSWHNDKALRMSFNSDDDVVSLPKGKRKLNRIIDSSDDDFQEPKRPNHRKRRFIDPDYESDEERSSDSSTDDDDKKNKRTSESKERNDDDSDVEYISTEWNTVIELDSDGEEVNKKSGRRRIRELLSDELLDENTKKAKKEESERSKRLKQKQLERLSQIGDDELQLCPEVRFDQNLFNKMLPHQVEGVRFMWDVCYESIDMLKNSKGTGCILAHNMGLGKTFQVVVLVHTLFSHPVTQTKRVLIVCPLSTAAQWQKHFHEGFNLAKLKLKSSLLVIRNDTFEKKMQMARKWYSEGGVMIMGYEQFATLTSSKGKSQGIVQELRTSLVDPGPDLVVCDEGHLLKNGKALRTMALMEMKTRRRIALTGTPLQNNLTEYYHMVQFVKPSLLGTEKEFKRQFVDPITNGQYEDSDKHDIKLMKVRTHVLHRLLKNTVQRYEAKRLENYIGPMKDYTLFIQLHPIQHALYKKFINMANKRRILTDKKFKSFFADFNILKYICSHPKLLYLIEDEKNRRKKKEIEVISIGPEENVNDLGDKEWFKQICPPDITTNIKYGTKLLVMLSIIQEAERIGDKVLIFSSSLYELNAVEYFLRNQGTNMNRNWKPRVDYYRMDGTVPPSIRTEMCDAFNKSDNRSLRVFLMSHKVGGLGLDLVAANRVILSGTNFNPSIDQQSIFRAYRFGQTKPVYIYRLLSIDTMEEKIYNRCVSKLAVASRVVDDHQIMRHYKNLDLEDLYKVVEQTNDERPTPTKPDDDLLSKILLEHKCVYKYHHHQKLLENQPDEDLNEEDKAKAWQEYEETNQYRNIVVPLGATTASANTVPTSVPSASAGSTQYLSLNPNLMEKVSQYFKRMLPLNQSSKNQPTPSTSTSGAHLVSAIDPLLPATALLKTRVPSATQNKNNATAGLSGAQRRLWGIDPRSININRRTPSTTLNYSFPQPLQCNENEDAVILVENNPGVNITETLHNDNRVSIRKLI